MDAKQGSCVCGGGGQGLRVGTVTKTRVALGLVPIRPLPSMTLLPLVGGDCFWCGDGADDEDEGDAAPTLLEPGPATPPSPPSLCAADAAGEAADAAVP